MSDIPVIDVSGLRSPVRSDREVVATLLHDACRNTGFFYASGHGVPQALIDWTFDTSQRYFAQPAEVKQAHSLKRSPIGAGYGEIGSEQLDPDIPPDFNESFNIALDLPADHPEILAGMPGRGVNVWPDVPGFRSAMLDHFEACLELGRLIHRGFCLDLGLAEDFFEDKLSAPMAVLRLLHYPASRGRTAPRQVGAGEHTDYGNLTLLATNGVAGLQLRRRDGVWIDAPSIPGAFICNIGDCLMRWTNDIYVSTPHRVLPPEHERYSIAFFLDPNPDVVVETISGFGAAKYPPISVASYMAERFDATYPHRLEPAS